MTRPSGFLRRWLSMAALLCLARALEAQVPSAIAPKTIAGHPQPGEGVIPTMTRDTADTLLGVLRRDSTDWVRVLKAYYGAGVYDPKLIDWVVFIDAAAGREVAIKQEVVSGKSTTTRVRGKKYVWVLVISTADLKSRKSRDEEVNERGASLAHLDSLTAFCRDHPELRCSVSVEAPGTMLGSKEYDSSKSGEDSALVASRRLVDYEHDASLGAVFKALVGADLPNPGTGALADSVVKIVLKQVVDPGAGVELYVGRQRFGIHQDASIVLSLRPSEGHTIPGVQSVSRTFTNSGAGWLNAGLAFGVTANAPDTAFTDEGLQGETTASTRWNAYLMATILFHRPQLPIRSRSYGVSVGTNIVNGDIFQDLITAVYFGRFPGDMGVLVGVDWISRTKRVATTTAGKFGTQEYRKPKLFGGVQFSF
jgi:hypothetical protein